MIPRMTFYRPWKIYSRRQTSGGPSAARILYLSLMVQADDWHHQDEFKGFEQTGFGQAEGRAR
jgi:hypothetical protein